MNTSAMPENVVREVDALTADLFREDDLGAVLRVQLRIENVLDQLIMTLLPSPDHLQLSGARAIRYELKVSLVLALGLLPDLEKSLRAFGRLRNDFAHRPNMQLDKQTVTDLYNTLGTFHRDQVLETFERMKQNHESLRAVPRFTALPPGDQFKVMTMAVWISVRRSLDQAAKLNSRHHANDSGAV